MIIDFQAGVTVLHLQLCYNNNNINHYAVYIVVIYCTHVHVH